jgi:endonuclease YncB( thermonuclease family)
MFTLLNIQTTYSKNIYPDIQDVIFIKNYDGDTITVNIPSYPDIIGKHISIRVSGVDTPEIKGKCIKEKILALQSKLFVYQKITESKTLYLTNIKRGKYFRIVADVIIDDINLSTLIIDNDLGVVYNGGTKSKDWCNNTK